MTACTKIQNYLCEMWEQCVPDAFNNTPRSCGANEVVGCRVPADVSASPSSATTSLMVGAIVCALIGCTCGIQGTRSIAGGGSVARTTLCCMGFLGCFVVGVLGMLGGYMLLGGGNNSARCSSIDLDPVQPLVQRLPLACVEVTGAYYVEKDISQSGKACILSSTVTAAVFVLESSLLLSRTVQNNNPNTFAGFEATIYFSYSLFANIGWIGIYIGEQQSIFGSFDDWTNYTTNLGYEYASLYPEGFPITFNQTEKLRLQFELAGSIWMNSSVVYLVGGIIVAVQIVGLYFATCGRESVWMTGVQVILYIDSFIIPYFIFIIYLCLTAVNLTYNLLAFLLLPATVQYLFAINFALQSDIWPLAGGQGPVQYACAIAQRLAPLMLISIFMLGFAMNRAEEGIVGSILMAVSGVISMVSLSLFLLVVFNEVIGFCCDSVQLVGERFRPPKQPADLEQGEGEGEGEEEEEPEAEPLGGPGAMEEAPEEGGEAGGEPAEAAPAAAEL